jgi:hypothetical protein
MSFALRVQDTSCLITSDKKLFAFDKALDEGYQLLHTNADTSHFSYGGISAFIEEDYTVRPLDIFKKIFDYVNRFISFPDRAYAIFVTLWAMGTYLFMIFRYYPYVWLNAEKASGKSLLMEVLAAISFNGELITNPTEAVIFRDISNNLISMFIDEVEQLRKRDKDVFSSVISLLNVGFCKSSVVKRVEGNTKGGFEVKRFSAYSPKMFAGINDIDDVLQDRTVKIPLLRKKDNETVQRFKNNSEIRELQKNIRDDLYVFALTHAAEMANLYQAREGTIDGMNHLTNRELDIWEPIFILANVIDNQSGNRDMTEAMEELSRKSSEEKQSDSVSQNDSYKILNILKEMLEELPTLDINDKVKTYDAKDVFEYFKKTEDFAWLERTNSLTSKLKRVKVKSEQRRFDGEKKRVYVVNITEFEDLCERFKI